MKGKEKKRTKVKEISRIEMAEYLLPDNQLTIRQKRRMFDGRNNTVDKG